jgi:hypothetical protein
MGGKEKLVALRLLASGHATFYMDSLVVQHHPSPARDSRLRRRMLARNAAWISCLRLPLPAQNACRATARAFCTSGRERHFRA